MIYTYKFLTLSAVVICEKFKALCSISLKKHLSSWRNSISESNSILFYLYSSSNSGTTNKQILSPHCSSLAIVCWEMESKQTSGMWSYLILCACILIHLQKD